MEGSQRASPLPTGANEMRVRHSVSLSIILKYQVSYTFYLYPYPYLLSHGCTVHYNRSPVTTSAAPHVFNQNSLVVNIMFISSPEIEQPFLNKGQHLVYQKRHRRTKQRLHNTRSVPHSFLVHSQLTAPTFLHSSHNCQFSHILVPHTIFTYCTYFRHNHQ